MVEWSWGGLRRRPRRFSHLLFPKMSKRGCFVALTQMSILDDLTDPRRTRQRRRTRRKGKRSVAGSRKNRFPGTLKKSPGGFGSRAGLKFIELNVVTVLDRVGSLERT